MENMVVKNIKTNLSQQQIKNQSRKTLDNSSKDDHLFRLDNVLEIGWKYFYPIVAIVLIPKYFFNINDTTLLVCILICSVIITLNCFLTVIAKKRMVKRNELRIL